MVTALTIMISCSIPMFFAGTICRLGVGASADTLNQLRSANLTVKDKLLTKEESKLAQALTGKKRKRLDSDDDNDAPGDGEKVTRPSKRIAIQGSKSNESDSEEEEDSRIGALTKKMATKSWNPVAHALAPVASTASGSNTTTDRKAVPATSATPIITTTTTQTPSSSTSLSSGALGGLTREEIARREEELRKKREKNKAKRLKKQQKKKETGNGEDGNDNDDEDEGDEERKNTISSTINNNEDESSQGRESMNTKPDSGSNDNRSAIPNSKSAVINKTNKTNNKEDRTSHISTTKGKSDNNGTGNDSQQDRPKTVVGKKDGKVLRLRPDGSYRTKRRSKQKNIRKDNRADELKPQGERKRELTEETKKRLGLHVPMVDVDQNDRQTKADQAGHAFGGEWQSTTLSTKETQGKAGKSSVAFKRVS